ncbi:MAG: helicase [Elusimicrobia bacterium GWC2_51_8]|nr:MAG: helicase [Elusimicrobia bacterium GWA2_51_34]OGR59581.1 MAG: helicase [Elusimicrobia bacterium GWC2_51_8]OGR85804.1 MAG: helicase [Elusimicrobia bacterium GWF2_52_66]HAF95841.1 helicase [Elusimicrobiota bacterium]HCE98278.1 helicase [Elusimicrobiota bacterium]
MCSKIDVQILVIDKAICGYINKFDASERGALSQAILQQLRNLVEHIMLKAYADGRDIDITYPNICAAIAFVKTRGELKFLRRFHYFLQIVVSHYTQGEEDSERLMLKYYEFLLKIREYLKARYSLDILGNLDKFPINTDSDLKEYYEKIADKVNRHNVFDSGKTRHERFYIRKIKPFFVGQRIYYEVTFTLANEKSSKFDRIIAFTALDISQFYAARLYTVSDRIEILGKIMPILIIVRWETSIRPCELNNFAKIFGVDLKMTSANPEYRELMGFLTGTGFSLVELIDFPDGDYSAVRQRIAKKTVALPFIDLLDECRKITQSSGAGGNVIRYLLYHLNNKIIKSQYEITGGNRKLSNLCLKNGCIPFDKMPFNTSLINHNPKLSDLFECTDSTAKEHELFARRIKNSAEIQGQLYTPVEDVSSFSDSNALIQKYNDALWWGHTDRRLETQNGQIYIRGYQEDTLFIIKKLNELVQKGITNYSKSVISWLQSTDHKIDSDEKKAALTEMFEKSTVVLIYGSAGTGKSTLINHISHLFSGNKKLYLANTNPAVDNLKRRVTASNCTFETIAKFLKRQDTSTEYDLLIIDECSTVNNRDMRNVLEKATFKLLVLVGDIYQIESIRFGNWFSTARSFIQKNSVFELTMPYRTKNTGLLELWRRVRHMDETILEHIAKNGYSARLDASIFEPAEADEIILCLNYDGLYGINNINRFLQESNLNPAIQWGIQFYKVNDPILFNESERFAPLIYNNTKGRIAGIKVFENQIQFDIELDKVINGMDAARYDFTLLEDSATGHSVISFFVNKYKSTDEDDDILSSAVVPFQVAYAVSIHKAQGLEYNSVKIVITDEVDELISHNIFYTAITRARNKLKIYWTPEVEKKVLSSIKPKSNNKDVALLRSINNL